MPYNNSHIKGWLRVVILMVAYLFVIGIFQLIGMVIADVDYRLQYTDLLLLQKLIVSCFDMTGTILLLLFFVKMVDGENFVEIGLKLKNRTKDIVLGIVLGLIIMGLAFLLLLSFDQITYDKMVFDIENLFYMFLLYIIVSVTEETLFRGYILRNFMYSFNKPVALLVSSFMFSIMHGLNPAYDFQAFINLFLAGILLGISYTFTKNLWFPIALHFSWNFFQSLFGFKVSGLDSYSLVEFSKPENNMFNGGEFGFEGSILSIIVQILLILGIFFWYKRKSNLAVKKQVTS